MKNFIIGIFALTSTLSNAQSDLIKATDVLKETKINDLGLVYTTKIKVITEKTKNTHFDIDQKSQLNQDRVDSPIMVTKKIMIDDDLDPFYDKAAKIKYLKYKDNKYGFLVDTGNRLVTYKLNEDTIDSANIIESDDPNYREINDVNMMSDIGYFDNDNDFIIEYYDVVNDEEETAYFEEIKM